ncbi:DUF4946 domain-containing protein [Pseudomonas sp. hsmgli-8]|uniref:DUF4946 domain-containing protein n=2 Tax=Pseudomonas TaxID=286 RepID=A0ABX0Y8F5_9PSED|nr:DUF4946 domain-containing protein [Pseudomonas sp. LY10J]NJO99594.1 DUF4946 domain-containing protein [Pseudomonas quercus]
MQKRFAIHLSVLLVLAGTAMAGEVVVDWPPGWQVEPIPVEAGSEVIRQRAVKPDANGDPAMVVELSQSPVEPGHVVNVAGVVLEMRTVVQKNFSQGGYQSACTRVKASTLNDVPAAETTCTITLNGGPVITQTLVAAAGPAKAWALSYAGTPAGYQANVGAVLEIRSSLVLNAEH